jgi:hypothetical protein
MKMSNLRKSLGIGTLVLALAGCSENEPAKPLVVVAPEKPAISKPLTYDLLEYRVKRGDTLTDVTDTLLKEETPRYGQRLNFGNRFVLEFDSDGYHGHVSPTGLLCEINGFGDACDSYYFEGVRLKIGQKLAIPDLNKDGQINGKNAAKVGTLEVTLRPANLSVDEIHQNQRTYGSDHRRMDFVEYKRK